MDAEETNWLASFKGTARLFPLPNLVLFPRAVQPLHVFEPRYRQLTEDALADDRLMALALLQPGWEEEYHKKPPVYPVVCLGRISAEQRLPDGRFYLLLHGLSRVRILEEVTTDRLYRTARVEVLADELLAADEIVQLRDELARAVEACSAFPESSRDQLSKLLHTEPNPGVIADLLAFALPLEPIEKQELLAQTSGGLRVRALLEHLKQISSPGTRKFPPDFSAN
jgi:Lon protease-like protein